MKKLIFVLIFGMIVSVIPAIAFAGQDDQGEDNDDQGLPIVVCPPGGCIQ